VKLARSVNPQIRPHSDLLSHLPSTTTTEFVPSASHRRPSFMRQLSRQVLRWRPTFPRVCSSTPGLPRALRCSTVSTQAIEYGYIDGVEIWATTDLEAIIQSMLTIGSTDDTRL
jgi:hypothetical protein